jgi:hypothetical protein
MSPRIALPAALVSALLLPATALADSGTTRITFGDGLLRARVAATPVAPAAVGAGKLMLPVAAVSDAGVTHTGGIRLRSGARSVTISGLQVLPTGSAWGLRGRVGGAGGQTLFTFAPGTTSATAVLAQNATLRLTAVGARSLNRKLRPYRALRAGPVGTIAVDASRTAANARPITGGSVAWGYNSALRTTFGDSFTPRLTGGVTQEGGPTGPFVLPVTGGSYDPATGVGSVQTGGSFRIVYQLSPSDSVAHGIWVTLANSRFDLTGAGGSIIATAESGYHDTPPVPPAVRTIATLAPGAPSITGDVVTWSAIPGTIAPGGAELVQHFKDSPGRPALGDVRSIDPVSISIQLG